MITVKNVRALCVKIAMDPQNISVDLRELKDICSDLEPSNKYLYKDGYRFSLGTILSDVNSYDLNSNTTANNTNLKSVQQQLFELAKPSDVLESKSLEDLLAEKTESYSSARSFFESCGVQPEIKKVIEGNAWMADQIFERLEQHISDFGLDNFTYKDGNIANLGDVTTAFANSLSALLPDGFEVDLTEAKTITAEVVRSDARKTADESVSVVIDQFTSEQWCSLQAPEYKSRILQESMGNFSDAITSEQKENYYKMYNNLKLEEKELFLTDFLTYSSEETDFQIQFNRTFDKAMQLFQLKKERQLALKKFPKLSGIRDQKKSVSLYKKEKRF